jgi:hypothetical protein
MERIWKAMRVLAFMTGTMTNNPGFLYTTGSSMNAADIMQCKINCQIGLCGYFVG